MVDKCQQIMAERGNLLFRQHGPPWRDTLARGNHASQPGLGQGCLGPYNINLEQGNRARPACPGAIHSQETITLPNQVWATVWAGLPERVCLARRNSYQNVLRTYAEN